MNENKSNHCTFTLRHGTYPTLFLNNQTLPNVWCIRYFGIHIDRPRIWTPYIKNKFIALNNRLCLLRLLLISKKIKIPNKLLIYKLLLKHIWTYGIYLCGAAKISYTNRIQRFQSKTFRTISKSPFYISNKSLRSDLKVSTVTQFSKLHYKRFNSWLNDHPNLLIIQLSSVSIPGNPQKKLKRQWCRDLLK
jgi:hypothetical protein